MPMPARAKRPCRHKGCAAITNDVRGYCDQHRQQHAGDGWRNYQSGKSRQERGLREGFPPSVAGDIYVAPNDTPDTLNAFLDAPKDADLRPEVMKRFEEW